MRHTEKILGFEILITTATHRMGKKVETAHLNGFIKEGDCYFQYATLPILKQDKMQHRYFQLHFIWEKAHRRQGRCTCTAAAALGRESRAYLSGG